MEPLLIMNSAILRTPHNASTFLPSMHTVEISLIAGPCTHKLRIIITRNFSLCQGTEMPRPQPTCKLHVNCIAGNFSLSQLKHSSVVDIEYYRIRPQPTRKLHV